MLGEKDDSLRRKRLIGSQIRAKDDRLVTREICI